MGFRGGGILPAAVDIVTSGLLLLCKLMCMSFFTVTNRLCALKRRFVLFSPFFHNMSAFLSQNFISSEEGVLHALFCFL